MNCLACGKPVVNKTDGDWECRDSDCKMWIIYNYTPNPHSKWFVVYGYKNYGKQIPNGTLLIMNGEP